MAGKTGSKNRGMRLRKKKRPFAQYETKHNLDERVFISHKNAIIS